MSAYTSSRDTYLSIHASRCNYNSTASTKSKQLLLGFILSQFASVYALNNRYKGVVQYK